MSFSLHGLGISQGIAIGTICLLRPQLRIPQYNIRADQVTDECARFNVALQLAQQHLKAFRSEIPLIYPDNSEQLEIASFIDPHLLMLEDSMLTQTPLEIIESQLCNAEWALKQQRDKLVSVFDAMDNAYLRERKQDVEQVVDRVQRCLVGEFNDYSDMALVPNGIVFADDLSPEDTSLMPKQHIHAFLTKRGGINSHTAIIARGLGIPAISGLHQAQNYLRHGDHIIVDAYQGTVLVDPDRKSLQYYQNLQTRLRQKRRALSKLKEAPCISQDGIKIDLQANMEFSEEIPVLKRHGAKHIGLYRTEFLFMHRDTMPDEDYQYRAYAKVLKSFPDGVVTIRTLDFGVDKQPGYDEDSSDSALGLRAIRLCLKKPDLLKPQLRAILRASVFGQARVLFPMLTNVQELLQAKQLWQDAQQELSDEGIDYCPDIPIGGMIEVPSMALCLDLFSPHVDFFSIGTNDLIQYTLAIDRNDDQVGHLYDPLHPAVLRLLKTIIDDAQTWQRPVSLCGEMGGDSAYVRLLLALGLRRFSVNPEALLEVKQIIINTDIASLSSIMSQLLSASTRRAMNELLALMNQ